MAKSRAKKRERVGSVTVYPRGRQWWVYYREGGKSRRKPVGTDRKEALGAAAEINAQITGGVPSIFGFERIAVDALVSRWLEHHDLVLRSSPATVSRYRTAAAHLRRFVQETGSPKTADRLSPREAEEFVKYLRRSRVSPNGHSNAPKRPLRDKGVIFVLEVCRNLFNYAARQRHLSPYSQNPFSNLRLDRMPVEDAKPIRLFSEEEETRFLDACDEWQFPMFFALAFTGMRPGELCHLLVEDVDLEAGAMLIRNHPELGWKTKTRNERVVVLFDELRDVVEGLVDGRSAGVLFRERQCLYDEKTSALDGLTFDELAKELSSRIDIARASYEGRWSREEEARTARRLWRDMGAIMPKKVRTEFISVARRIGRPDMTCPKVWRHQMATSMQSADVDPFVRKKILGHTDLAMTGLYTHTTIKTIGAEMGKVLAEKRQVLDLASRRAGRNGAALQRRRPRQ